MSHLVAEHSAVLPDVRCPACYAGLDVHEEHENHKDHDIEYWDRGEIQCPSCGHIVEVRHHIWQTYDAREKK